ncbi:copper amine oxidase [Arthrobacter pigmenti]
MAMLISGLSACSDSTAEPDPTEETAAAPEKGQEKGQETSKASAGNSCRDGQELTHTFDSGAEWALCWQVKPNRGLLLTDIYYSAPEQEPRKVIDSIALAQLEVPYDHGKRITSDITSAGFGGHRMKTLTEAECSGERLAAAIPNIGDGTYGSSPTRKVLCSEEVDASLSYRSFESGELTTARASEWNLYTVSKVGWYEYLNQFTFGEDGSIRPLLGATGDLSPVDYTNEDHGWAVGEGDSHHAASHSHNAVWRVDWGLGDGGQQVEQYDAEPTGEHGPESPIVRGKLIPIEVPSLAASADRRWWRVLDPNTRNEDGHPISYQIDLAATDSFTFVPDHHEHGAGSGYDIAFTNADDCQIYATHNRGGCGESVLDYVNESKLEKLDDVVSWVAVGFHHVPRDEDQSPMELHWQGFSMTPRDLLAQRPGVPDNRKGINGQPEEWEGEDIDDLAEPHGD